jgi:hypothetical protein
MGKLRPLGSLAIVIALTVLPWMAGTALGATCQNISGPTQVCTADNIPAAGVALPSCPGQTLLHFVITSPSDAQAFEAFTVVAHFDTGDSAPVNWEAVNAGPNGTDQADVFIPPPSGATKLTSATTEISDSLTFGNFVLSGTPSCVTSGGPGTNTPGTSAVPELDSLVLFGAGALGLAGFALYQRRRQRGEA